MNKDISLPLLTKLRSMTYLRILISIIVIGFLLTWIPISDLWNTAKQVTFPIWILSVMIFLIGHSIGVFKWFILVNTGNNRLPLLAAFRFYYYGLFANLFLPSIAGGDFIRAGMAVRHVREKESIILGSILDRLLDIGSLILLILIGVVVTNGSPTNDLGKILFPFLLILSVFIIFCLLLLLVRIPGIVPKRISETLTRIRGIIKYLITNPQYALGAFSLSFLIQGGFVLLNAFLGSMCGIDLSYKVWLVVWPMAKLAAMLPISLGGLGVREVALAFLLAQFGILSSTAVGYGLVWETILISGSFIGFTLSLSLRRDVLAVIRAITHKNNLRNYEGIK